MSFDLYISVEYGNFHIGGIGIWTKYWEKYIRPNLDVQPVMAIVNQKFDTLHGKNYFHKKMKTFRQKGLWTPMPVEWIMYSHDYNRLEELMKNCRRINILHPKTQNLHLTDLLEKYQHKIHSTIIHAYVNQIQRWRRNLDIPGAPGEHEIITHERPLKWARYSIWIGLTDIPICNTTIPNPYLFRFYREPNESNVLLFPSRPGFRKRPDFLENKVSLAFSPHNIKNLAKQNFGASLRSVTVIKYKARRLYEIFGRNDTGLMHGAYLKEPFGYSIFQSVDFGKLPILDQEWCKWTNTTDYPFQCDATGSIEGFNKAYEKAKETDIHQRRFWIKYLRNKLKKVGDPERWKSQMLSIYND